MRQVTLSGICAAICLLTACQKPQVTHGPYVGQIRQDVAKVWLRTNQATRVIVEYSATATFTQPRQVSLSTVSARDFTAKLELPGLAPGSDVFYRIRLNGQLSPGTYRFRTAPANPAAPVKVAVLSDFQRWRYGPALATAMSLSPDLLVFLGDLDHRDPPRLAKMRQMHKALRAPYEPFGSVFHSKVVKAYPRPQPPFLHVWDDHDFGKNDADRTFAGKADAMRAFDEYFIMASRDDIPPDQRGGVWQQQSYGCADFFLLDVRAMRDPRRNADGPTKSIMGAAQKVWLKERLLASTAPWKVIFSPTPFNPGTKPNDSWGSYLHERNELVSFIRGNNIKGIVFVSGDIHSGGAIDDGTNSDFPEVSVPHANLLNFYDTFYKRPGTWSHGLLSGSVGAGFVWLDINPTRLVMSARSENGTVRKTYTVRP